MEFCVSICYQLITGQSSSLLFGSPASLCIVESVFYHPPSPLVPPSSTDLYDSSTEARLLRQFLQRLSIWVVVLSKLGLHHLHVQR